MAVDDEGRLGDIDGAPDEASEPWDAWEARRPVVDARLERRSPPARVLTTAVLVSALAVFVSSITVAELPTVVVVLWVVGGAAAVAALIGSGDYFRYRDAWRRRTGTYGRDELEGRASGGVDPGVSPEVAAHVYLRDSARAVAGQDRAFARLVVGSAVAAVAWLLSVVVLVG